MFSGTLFRQNIFNNLLRFLTALRISEFIQGLSRERTPTILLGRPTYVSRIIYTSKEDQPSIYYTRSYYRKGSAALQPKVLGIDYTLYCKYTVCMNLICLIMQ